MGGQNSRSADSSSKTSRQDWREMQWSKEKALQYINNYQPHKEDIQHLRILLHGPIGAGKSSFINSVDAVLQGRTTSRALANVASKESFTEAYKTFKINKGEPGKFYPFAFTDIMGVDKYKNKGVGVKDVRLAMKGHVNDGYKFSTDSPISEEARGYNNSPSLTDKVHALVYVISANKAKTLSDNCMKKLKDVRHEASLLDGERECVAGYSTVLHLSCEELPLRKQHSRRRRYADTECTEKDDRVWRGLCQQHVALLILRKPALFNAVLKTVMNRIICSKDLLFGFHWHGFDAFIIDHCNTFL